MKDANGLEQTETTFELSFSTTPETVVQIGTEISDQAGVLKRLSPALYQGSDILTAYEYYFAGGGFQVVVRRLTPNSIVVSKRSTDEGSAEEKGGCMTWNEIATIDIDPKAKVTIDEAASQTQDQMDISCAW